MCQSIVCSERQEWEAGLIGTLLGRTVGTGFLWVGRGIECTHTHTHIHTYTHSLGNPQAFSEIAAAPPSHRHTHTQRHIHTDTDTHTHLFGNPQTLLRS